MHSKPAIEQLCNVSHLLIYHEIIALSISQGSLLKHLLAHLHVLEMGSNARHHAATLCCCFAHSVGVDGHDGVSMPGVCLQLLLL